MKSVSVHPSALQRFLLGKPLAADRSRETRRSKRWALPVFAPTMVSAVAYAPDEILLTLALAGIGAIAISPWVGLAVVLVMAVVVAAYRQNIDAYPTGGGDYEVATKNLGRRAGLTVASAMLIDFALTVAVSVAAAAHYLAAPIPALADYRLPIAILTVIALALVNLRHSRESGRVLAIPVYLYLASIGLLTVVGAVRYALGTLPPAASAGLELTGSSTLDAGLMGFAGAMLVLRVFSSGCAALTSVANVSTRVHTFSEPQRRNARVTLVVIAAITAVLLLAVILLARLTGVRMLPESSANQDPVIAQLAAAIFDFASPLVIIVVAATAIVLVVAANSAINALPVLGAIVARDSYLPRQLYTRGDRMVFSRGIVVLAVVSIALIVVFGAEVTRLIQLYIVGAFLSFSLSQFAMVRHFTRALSISTSASERRLLKRRRVIAAIAFVLTALVLAVTLITKFFSGAWLTLVLIGAAYLIMTRIGSHYAHVAEQLAVPDVATARALPSRVHAIVLVSALNRPALQAISYARATRPATLQAVHVAANKDASAKLRKAWEDAELPIDLTMVDSPNRDISRPVIDYVRSIRRQSPRDLIVVFLPEFVVKNFSGHLLHNNTALRLKSRLLSTPGIVVSSVPYLLDETGQEGTHEPPR
ncbi:DNA-binding protein [Bowdeniella nasicola]|uniref:DNA-binding protein n=1 Tax=Bowdeniella nasicola TaxID=208480 RepID=A0A1Q5Q5C1_9ACTO|nr:DNA-binding protein [Bowdeniella nasicola]